MKGQIVNAGEVVPGDRIILPVLGSRVVLDVSEFFEDTGADPGPRIRIVYGLGLGHAFENSARKGKRPSSFTQPEGSLRPLRPDDEIEVERAADDRVAIARRTEGAP